MIKFVLSIRSESGQVCQRKKTHVRVHGASLEDEKDLGRVARDYIWKNPDSVIYRTPEIGEISGYTC